MYRYLILLCFFSLSLPVSAAATLTLHALKVETPPVVDGRGDESIWQHASPTVVHDVVADIDITLKATYTNERIYLIASFEDATENREHRSLIWNSELQSYENGPAREDVLVLKWNMSPHETDLTLHSDRPYRADIWFWKAHRTDHSGYADDKVQFYTTTRKKNGQQLISKSGKVFYLQRQGDEGESAYLPELYVNYVGATAEKYQLVIPTGSRADVRAKGVWHDGHWTIEFSRALDTGHSDDLQFSPERSYRFGVSRYEIAGRDSEPQSEQPLYGCGEVGELIDLVFDPASP
nr:ethylbenzene dehydrogenase-related protein [uncultured Desulfuromonas sp.]